MLESGKMSVCFLLNPNSILKILSLVFNQISFLQCRNPSIFISSSASGIRMRGVLPPFPALSHGFMSLEPHCSPAINYAITPLCDPMCPHFGSPLSTLDIPHAPNIILAEQRNLFPLLPSGLRLFGLCFG